ncbi:hypothetical protein IAQ61_009757 [Plenodomus lingam]|uniref:uncharacterized protein n=1 Tax=Leptosphaeria maculans TaxID=5022 RepID=UPI00331CA71D|nr:hypothetical protein IAQ61_009757 [Plenodomus lingam]
MTSTGLDERRKEKDDNDRWMDGWGHSQNGPAEAFVTKQASCAAAEKGPRQGCQCPGEGGCECNAASASVHMAGQQPLQVAADVGFGNSPASQS